MPSLPEAQHGQMRVDHEDIPDVLELALGLDLNKPMPRKSEHALAPTAQRPHTYVASVERVLCLTLNLD